jgi:hypothetical protein
MLNIIIVRINSKLPQQQTHHTTQHTHRRREDKQRGENIYVTQAFSFFFVFTKRHSFLKSTFQTKKESNI